MPLVVDAQADCALLARDVELVTLDARLAAVNQALRERHV